MFLKDEYTGNIVSWDKEDETVYEGYQELIEMAMNGNTNCFDCPDCRDCHMCNECYMCKRCIRCNGCTFCSDVACFDDEDDLHGGE